jgi:hypothetical protein
MVGCLEGNIRAEMSGDAGFRAFADRIEGQSQVPLLYFEKLFAEICDYHYLHYNKFFVKVKALKAGFRVTLWA